MFSYTTSTSRFYSFWTERNWIEQLPYVVRSQEIGKLVGEGAKDNTAVKRQNWKGEIRRGEVVESKKENLRSYVPRVHPSWADNSPSLTCHFSITSRLDYLSETPPEYFPSPRNSFSTFYYFVASRFSTQGHAY